MSLGCCECQTLAVAVPGIAGPPGPPGPPGPAGGSAIQRTTAHALAAYRLVVPRDDGTVEYASADTAAHANRPVWITTAAWGAGVLATVTVLGLVVNGSWAWTPGLPILLGLNGNPVHTQPGTGVFLRRIGLVADATTLDFDPDQPVVF